LEDGFDLQTALREARGDLAHPDEVLLVDGDADMFDGHGEILDASVGVSTGAAEAARPPTAHRRPRRRSPRSPWTWTSHLLPFATRRRYHGAMASPDPTSSEGRISRVLCSTRVAHSSRPRNPVTSLHSVASPATCGVAMEVPLIAR